MFGHFCTFTLGPHAIRSEATARQRRGGREERCDDWEPPGDSEAAAGACPLGGCCEAAGGQGWERKKDCLGNPFVVPVGHDPTTP